MGEIRKNEDFFYFFHKMLSVYSLNAAKGLSFSETEDFASVELSVMIDKRVELLARPLACVVPALGRCAFCACAKTWRMRIYGRWNNGHGGTMRS